MLENYWYGLIIIWVENLLKISGWLDGVWKKNVIDILFGFVDYIGLLI